MSPLVLPKASKSDVLFRNIIFGTQRTIPFSIGHEAWQFEFDSEVPVFESPVPVTLLVGNEQVQVELSDLDAIAAVRQMLAGVPLNQLPPELQLISLEAALESLLDTLQKTWGQPVRLHRMGITPVPANPKVSFVLSSGTQRIFGRATMPPAIRDLLQKLTNLVAPSSAERPVGVSFMCDLEWGRATLPLSELRTLQVHDVLLADQTSLVAPDLVRLVCPHQKAYPAKLSGRELTIAGPAESIASARGQVATDRTANRTDLPVVCVLSCGQLELNSAELLALAPDQTLKVDTSDDNQLQVVVGSEVLFTGEAVEIGSRVGVRILQQYAD